MTCFNCGEANDFPGITSFHINGWYDLDLRPPETARSALKYRVNRCPSCGYCAYDLAAGYNSFKNTLKSELYLNQLNNPEYPELANTFLCISMLFAGDKYYAIAVISAIQASWVCDDLQPDQAINCRRKALEYYELVKSEGQSLTTNPICDQLVIADLLRRCNEFDKSIKIVEDTFSPKLEANIQQGLIYEKHLAENRDAKCHTFEEAKEYAESREKSPN